VIAPKSPISITRFRAAVVISSLALLVSGCTSTTDATWATAQNLLPSWARPVPQPSNPNYDYLRVTINGRSALLVLGEIDQHPLGRIDSFYSGEAEVLKLQNGRIVGSGGMTTNWVKVTLTSTATGYERTRDVMPNYRFGLRDVLEIKTLARPPSEIKTSKELTRERLAQLSWTGEAPKTKSPLGRIVIGRDTDGTPRVGYQCLDDGLCLQWERL
jgi:hypothetical protein